jgi:signal transduction histidine kinase
VSRIAAGRLELHVEAVDLAQIVNEVGTRFSDEAARVGPRSTFTRPGRSSDDGTRAASTRWSRTSCPTRSKYGDNKPIDVTLEAEDDRAVVTIRDRGLGIAPNDHERIFGRFERAASTRHYGGIGLGLWIVKQIIDALGGTVTVESTPGTGSTFTVELPRSADKAHHPTAGGGLERLLAAGAHQPS